MNKLNQFEVIWPFIKNGAIQRAKLKAGLSEDAKTYLRKKVFEKYFGKFISEDELYSDLQDMNDWLGRRHKKMNHKDYFGNAQKFINLTLKAMWILGWLKGKPPHFPVDRIIQKAIQTGKTSNKPYSWTDMNYETYKKIISAPKRKDSKGEYECNQKDNLANWELDTYITLTTKHDRKT